MILYSIQVLSATIDVQLILHFCSVQLTINQTSYYISESHLISLITWRRHNRSLGRDSELHGPKTKQQKNCINSLFIVFHFILSYQNSC